MSLADDKRSVFTTIGAYTSFMEQNKLPRIGELYSSINNKKDVVPYLLDVLKTIAGTEALKKLTGDMITKLVDSSEETLKTALKNQFTQFNSGDNLPNSFKSNGINLSVKNIDINGKFKISPASDSGQLLYNNSLPNFDSIAHNAILNAGTSISFLNMDIKYNEISDSFNIKPPVGTNVNIGKYFDDFIDSTEIINKNEFLTNIMNSIYGVLSSKSNKTPTQILEELEVEQLLEQVINGDDSFAILPQDYNSLLQKANELANGIVNYDMGCGLMAASLPFDSLNTLINTISASTDSFLVGNAIEATIGQSTTGNTQTTAENKETIKDGFFQKLIKIFTVQLLRAVTTAPQIRALLGIMSFFQNNGTTLIGKASDDMNKFKTLIKCMANEVIKMISEFIFNLAVSYLIMLLSPIIKKILNEKINQFVNIIKSLTHVNVITSSG